MPRDELSASLFFAPKRIMAKLASTSTAQISLSFLVMNLEMALKRFFFRFFCCATIGPREFSPDAPPVDGQSATNELHGRQFQNGTRPPNSRPSLTVESAQRHRG